MLTSYSGDIDHWEKSTDADFPAAETDIIDSQNDILYVSEFGELQTGNTYFRAVVIGQGICSTGDVNLYSTPATITVNPAPVINSGPETFNLEYNTDGTYKTTTATFTVDATADCVPVYQWQVQATVESGDPVWEDLSGAVSASLIIESAPNFIGYGYRCIISCLDCSITSEPAYIEPPASCPQPAITSDPANINNVCIGTEVSFSVIVQGSEASHTFQWYKGTPGTGALIVGAINASYTISQVTLDDAGSYYVIATNACGESVTSATAILTIETTPPEITCAVTITQTVDANSGDPLTQYLKSGTDWDATANDNCDQNPILTWALTGATNNSNSAESSTLNGVTFNEGTTTVTWTATDDAGNTDECSFDVIVNAKADLSIQKEAITTEVVIGGELKYLIIVTNNGPSIARNITITDDVSGFLSSPQYSLDDGTYAAWTGSYDVPAPGNIPNRGTVTLYIKGTLSENQCTSVSNTASVSSDNDANLANNSHTIETANTRCILHC